MGSPMRRLPGLLLHSPLVPFCMRPDACTCCPYVRGGRLVANVTTRQAWLRWNARIRSNSYLATNNNKTTSGSGSGVNQKNASIESSRTSLGRCYGSGVGRRVSEILEPGKVGLPRLPKRRRWPHGSSHAFKDTFLVLRSRARTRGKPRVREAVASDQSNTITLCGREACAK